MQVFYEDGPISELLLNALKHLTTYKLLLVAEYTFPEIVTLGAFT